MFFPDQKVVPTNHIQYTTNSLQLMMSMIIKMTIKMGVVICGCDHVGEF